MNTHFTACCEFFRNLLLRGGEKGFAILPRVQLGKRAFSMQWRAFDKEDIDYLMNTMPDTGRQIPISRAIMLPLRHCPSCGKKLSETIEQNPQEFDVAAQEAEPFFLE